MKDQGGAGSRPDSLHEEANIRIRDGEGQEASRELAAEAVARVKRTAKSKVDNVLSAKARHSGISNVLTKRSDAPTDRTSGDSLKELQPMNLLRGMEREAAS